MSVRRFAIAPRTRRALAAAAVVLSVGGLALLRASGAPSGPSLPSPGPNGVSFSGPDVAGSLALSHGRVFADHGQSLYAELRLASTVERAAAARAPLCLALVLDTSGSMQGDKIEQARQSMLRLVDAMQDADEIALVRYDDRAELLQPLTQLGAVRSSVRARLLELQAGGGTNIPAGLTHGLDALRAAASHRIARLVLVSDGLDASQSLAEALARQSASRGITISALGIGLDFDEAYLSAVARLGRGNFGFVSHGAALATFLDRELRETAATTVRQASARLRLPAGMRFVRAVGAEAQARMGDREVELALGSLFAGDERRVVVELASEARDGERLDLQAEVIWTDVADRRHELALDPLGVEGTASLAAVDASRDQRVYARCASAFASLRGLEAAQAYAAGDTGRAEALLDQSLSDLRSAASAAPAEEASRLEAQIESYEQTQSRFRAAAPASEAGRSAAKAAAAEDAANLPRSTF